MLPLVGVANAQQRINAPHTDNLSEFSAGLRRRYRGYDRWTTSDVSRLQAADVIDLVANSGRGDTNYSLVPQAIRTQYGEEQGARQFMIAVHARLRELHLEDAPMNFMLRGTIGREIGLTEQQVQSLVLERPYDIRLTDGTAVRTTPAQAMYHRVNRTIMNPDQPLADPRATEIAIPDAVLEAIISFNPQYRTQLEGLRGRAIFSIDPRVAYTAGQVAQSFGTNNITDWRQAIAYPAQNCAVIEQVENDIYDREFGDVRMDEAWFAGSFRAKSPAPDVVICPI